MYGIPLSVIKSAEHLPVFIKAMVTADILYPRAYTNRFRYLVIAYLL